MVYSLGSLIYLETVYPNIVFVWSINERILMDMYFIAIICPPLAILLTGKPFQALLNVFLCLLGWVPGIIHAILVVNAWTHDKRTARLERALRDR